VSQPASSLVTRMAYCVSQLPRVAWYVGHGLMLRRVSKAARRRDGGKSRPRLRVDGAVPDRSQIYSDMAKLFLQDLANVESGIYPLPEDHDGSLLTLIAAHGFSLRIYPRFTDVANAARITKS
jgi:hypothetical protein